MIDELASLESAALDPALLERVLQRHRGEVHGLLATAAQEWIADGCPRFNENETSCSAALIGFLQSTVLRGRTDAFQIAVFLETGGWTEAHLEGRADPTTVPRPDVALFLGVHHDVQMTVECKRLLDPNSTATDYVSDGLIRFLTGRYSSDAGQATMIGFLLDRDDAQACDDINTVIRVRLDPRQILRRAPALGSFDAVYRSRHPAGKQELDAIHLLLDIQGRAPPRGRTRE